MNLPFQLATPAPLARPLAAVKGGLASLEAMRQRDRLALTAALLSLIVGLDLLVVLPVHDKRLAIQAAQRDSADNEEATRSSRLVEREAQLVDLRARQARVTKALAAFGASGKPAESLRFLLSRTLQTLPVAVLSLRALGVEEVEVTPGGAQAASAANDSASASASATATATAAAAAAAAAAETASVDPSATGAPTVLYRHRYELHVGGELPVLLTALEALESNARPLRIERVRLQADAAGALQAQVVLMTLGSERTWLTF